MISHARISLLTAVMFGAFHAAAQINNCSVAPKILHHKIDENYKGARIAVEYPEIPEEPVFNKAVLAEVNSRIKGVKEEADGDEKNPPPTGRRGSIGSDFSVTNTQSGIISILISFGLEGSMSVHPWEELVSINYDPCHHRLLRLGDLFLPNSQYLSRLSRITTKSLEAREYAYSPTIRSGASPTLKNFKTFTVNDRHLTIYFQQYQVAAGAAGSTSVKISWKELRPMLNRRYLKPKKDI